jgi:hypothetical protein
MKYSMLTVPSDHPSFLHVSLAVYLHHFWLENINTNIKEIAAKKRADTSTSVSGETD